MKTNLIKFFTFVIFTSILLNSCGFYKRSDIKDNPVNVDERVKKNVQEGRGFRFGKGATRGGDFDFASSNPLWRSSVEVLDFVPLTNASYSGGIIITDWYSEKNSPNKSIKISIRFLTNEVRSDALDIKIFSRECTDTLANCSFSELGGNLSAELKKEILKKAALYKKEIDSKKPESNYTYPVVD